MNYYALNLNLWIFVDILTIIFGRRRIFCAQIVKWHHFWCFVEPQSQMTSFRWNYKNCQDFSVPLLQTFDLCDTDDIKIKDFSSAHGTKNKMWCAILFCKWCHVASTIIKLHTFVNFSNFQTSEIKFKK